MTDLIESDQLTRTQARRLIADIQRALNLAWKDVTKAYQGRAWSALGYASWDELCHSEFRTHQIRLPREERQEVVASLREAGMSTRAIASVTGTSVGTVHGDISRCSELNTSIVDDEPRLISGIDGKTYRPARGPEQGGTDSTTDLETPIDAEIVEETPTAADELKRPLTTGEESIGSPCGTDRSEYTATRAVCDWLISLSNDQLEPENRDKLLRTMRRAIKKLEKQR